MTETFKQNTAPPIPRPVEPIDEVEPEIPEPIPELDVSDFQEIESNVTLTPEEQFDKKVIVRKLHSYYLTFPRECGCRESPELNSVIQELTIKYQNEVVLGPEQRLGLIMVGLCSQIHAHNKSLQTDETEPKPINDEEKGRNEKREKMMKDLDEDV